VTVPPDQPQGQLPDGRPDAGNEARLEARSGRTYRWTNDKLGEGGQGTVYRGFASDDQVVAIKRVGLRQSSVDKWMADGRLAEREIDVGRRLTADSSSHLIPILDDALTDEALWIIMPLAGPSLSENLRDGGVLTEGAVRQLALDAAGGLRALAERSVVHRDIKPSNILRFNETWALTDFGIARDLTATTSTHTWMGTGTYAYWAPELFDHHPATPKSDLYALGCTLIEALTGESPFSGNDLRGAHLLQVPKVPDLNDPVLRRVILRLIAKDPAARPADAREVEQMLVPRNVSPSQKIFQGLATRAAEHALRREANERGSAAMLERASAALVRFSTVWEQLGVLLERAVGDTLLVNQNPQWFLTAAEGRLQTHLIEPSPRNKALWIGELGVKIPDQHARSVVANIVCLDDVDDPVWKIYRFRHNQISSDRTPLGPARGADSAGISIDRLNRLLPVLDAPGPPVLIREEMALQPEILLDLFAGEYSALIAAQDQN